MTLLWFFRNSGNSVTLINIERRQCYPVANTADGLSVCADLMQYGGLCLCPYDWILCAWLSRDIIHFHGHVFFQQPVSMTALPGTVPLLTSVRAANGFSSSISGISPRVHLRIQNMLFLWASKIIQHYRPILLENPLQRNLWGGLQICSSSISCHFFHFSISAFSVSFIPSCLSVSCLFQPHFSFWMVVLSMRGLGSFHGTTAYQRHSREPGEVTSVLWRYKVLQCFLRTSGVAPFFS